MSFFAMKATPHALMAMLDYLDIFLFVIQVVWKIRKHTTMGMAHALRSHVPLCSLQWVLIYLVIYILVLLMVYTSGMKSAPHALTVMLEYLIIFLFDIQVVWKVFVIPHRGMVPRK